MVKKADIILFLGLIIIAAALFISFFAFPQNDGTTLVVTLQGEEYARLPLNKDTVLVLPHNTVEIANGYAFVKSADCPDKVCINNGKISKRGQTTVCLPAELILEVE